AAGEHPGGGRAGARRAAARREPAVTRFALDDRPRRSRAAMEQLVIAEHRTREEHAGKSRVARALRLLDRGNTAREPAGNARRARDVREEREVRELPALRAVER